MICIFDCETSGFHSLNYPPEHPNQGRVLQFAALLLDEYFEEMASFNFLIKQHDALIVHPKAFEQHGISKELCDKFGVPLEVVLMSFDTFLNRSMYHAAYNIQFDIRMMKAEDQVCFSGASKLPFKQTICCMESAARLDGEYKRLKLADCYEKLFGIKPKASHDSLEDCRSTAKILEKLITDGKIVLRPENVIELTK
jgi:DNA polymerase III epsilon subunit-like protein